MGCLYTEKGINIGSFKLQGKGWQGTGAALTQWQRVGAEMKHGAGSGKWAGAALKPAKAGNLGAADESSEEVQKQGMGMQPGFKKELDKFMGGQINCCP